MLTSTDVAVSRARESWADRKRTMPRNTDTVRWAMRHLSQASLGYRYVFSKHRRRWVAHQHWCLRLQSRHCLQTLHMVSGLRLLWLERAELIDDVRKRVHHLLENKLRMSNVNWAVRRYHCQRALLRVHQILCNKPLLSLDRHWNE